ncbi:MAG: hypothetical protein LKI42_03845 [Bacteroidales bacterium]|jgi:hypothetical protein|nr:hypothetical protein [Bacteroidales bacterium]MCI1784819.1 hypothetical protein [Bacteroidales bacterium]
MYTISESYEVFERMLDVEKVYLIPYLDFNTICGWIGVCPAELDILLSDELGMSGEELLVFYRSHWKDCFFRKYKVKG